jgi:hypothetical protein
MSLRKQTISSAMKGVYKIAYKWETIFVASSSSRIAKQLVNHLGGHGQQDLFNFLNNLRPEDIEDVSVYWLDEREYDHCCCQSYITCISRIQGKRPMFNATGKKTRGPDRYSNVLPTGTDMLQGASYLGIFPRFSYT